MSKITQKKYILYVGSVKSWREDLESHIQKKGLLWQIVSLTQKSPEIEIKEERLSILKTFK
jgi:hypothetical protein